MKNKSLFFLLCYFATFGIFTNSAFGENSIYTGTGFIINNQGHAITNHHVIDECQNLTVYLNSNPIQGKIVFKDSLNDLAILKLNFQPRTYAKFRYAKSLLLGEKVLVAGYPLQGILASDLNFTTGIVSSIAGAYNSKNKLQITAPVQSGNSGGPLIAANGNIIGVIVSRLNNSPDLGINDPQNVNFAIKGIVARSFLNTHGIPFELSKENKKYETHEIAAMARGYTIYIECKNSDEK